MLRRRSLERITVVAMVCYDSWTRYACMIVMIVVVWLQFGPVYVGFPQLWLFWMKSAGVYLAISSLGARAKRCIVRSSLCCQAWQISSRDARGNDDVFHMAPRDWFAPARRYLIGHLLVSIQNGVVRCCGRVQRVVVGVVVGRHAGLLFQQALRGLAVTGKHGLSTTARDGKKLH